MNNRPETRNSLINIVKDYFDKILKEAQGVKSLILDEETTGIISLICSQSQILQKDVYLIERIEQKQKEKMIHLKAIYFIRPTFSNMEMLEEELKDPRFREYYLFFSNSLPDDQLRKLAEVDSKDVIKQVQEVYVDYYAINSDLFSLNINQSMYLSSKEQFNDFDTSILSRILDGLYSICLSLRKLPIIKYINNSKPCRKIAELLLHKLKQEFQNTNTNESQRMVLIITDRNEDPITPLLNQWSYQAMLHELIGIENNRLLIKNNNNNNANLQNEYVVNQQQDEFYNVNLFSNFGDLAQNIKEFIKQMSEQRQGSVKIESIEDMQKALDMLPEIKRMSGNVQKHVSLSTEISRLIDERQLMKVSEIEQEISVNFNKNEHFKMVTDIINDQTINQYEKLKLTLIFAIKYQSEYQLINKLRDLLSFKGINSQSINIINYLLNYSGSEKRQNDLFGQKNMMNKAKSLFKQAFKDVPNVYTQHSPYIMSVIEQLKKGQLKETEFVTLNPSNYQKISEIVYFQLGGTTYEEAKEIGQRNIQMGFNEIILGGTTIHNSKTFLAELTQTYQQQAIQTYFN